MIGRADAARTRLGYDPDAVLTREEYRNGWGFGDDGEKVNIEEQWRQARAELEATLDRMRDRLEATPPCELCGQ